MSLFVYLIIYTPPQNNHRYTHTHTHTQGTVAGFEDQCCSVFPKFKNVLHFMV